MCDFDIKKLASLIYYIDDELNIRQIFYKIFLVIESFDMNDGDSFVER